MGEQKVSKIDDGDNFKDFINSLLDDVGALKYMLDNDWFEKDIIRIGAEQEMVMTDKESHKPAPIIVNAMKKMDKFEWCETELAKFNLEINLEPREYKTDCFEKMEDEIHSHLGIIRENLDELGADIILTGVLPTLRKTDLGWRNLTPKKRYKALMESIKDQKHGDSEFELRMIGVDELIVKHNSPLIEACNTSFQVHLQVSPENFTKMYNISQALAAPVMAIAANSPLVFGKRLWHESRIALFQQSVDTRTIHDYMRNVSPRVSFGSDWLNGSVLDIYKEDISRFRVLLGADVKEDSILKIKEGVTPKLTALQVHNSTVYRWNRPCYGVSPNGKPHLRIENRVLPSGPTVVDEMANTVLWLGAMIGLSLEIDDVRDHMSFEDARDNFGKAARHGIDAQFTWFGNEKYTASQIILKKLLPLARKGLESRNVNKESIDRYLGIIEKRAELHTNGARWLLRGYTKLKRQVTEDQALSTLTAVILRNQLKNIPVHEWDLPNVEDLEQYLPTMIKAEEFMETDLFTVKKDDPIELVAEMMDWRQLRYTMVEGNNHSLLGLVSYRLIMRYLIDKQKGLSTAKIVKDIMVSKLYTVSPTSTIVKVMEIMQEHDIGCLPVLNNKKLVGVITEKEFLGISKNLLRQQLSKKR